MPTSVASAKTASKITTSSGENNATLKGANKNALYLWLKIIGQRRVGGSLPLPHKCVLREGEAPADPIRIRISNSSSSFIANRDIPTGITVEFTVIPAG